MASRFFPLSIRTTISLILSSLVAIVVVIATTDMIDATSQTNRLATASENARASRDLFRTLAEGRSERGNLNSFLQAPTAVGPDFESRVVVPRQANQTAYLSARELLKGNGMAGLAPAVEALRVAEAALTELRPKADAAAHQPTANRDAEVVAAWPETAQKYLDSLGVVSEIVDAETAMSDPIIAHYLTVKRAAWAARLGNGGYGFRIGGALAAKRGWTPAEAAAAREDRGRSLAAWDVMARAAARPGAPAHLREAVAKAATNFVGPSYDVDRGIMETLSTGAASTVTISELVKRYATDQALIVDVAVAAADLMVAEADIKYGIARTEVVRDAALLALAVIVTGIGFLVLRWRVTQPLAALVSAMLVLAGRDMRVVIPGTGRRDEIGSMADAVAVFRHDMLERERLAAAADVEQSAQVARAARVETAMAAFERKAEALAHAVSNRAAYLGEAAHLMTDAAGRTGREAAEVAEVASTASADVQGVATATEQLSSSIREISRQVATSAMVADDAGAKAQRSSEAMRELMDSSGRIGTVVTAIANITRQINLLALNATIEAARAGESGKGFAIVAGEVKALAKRTEQATAEIDSQIQRIQLATGHVVQIIPELVQSVGTIRDIAVVVAAAVEQQSAATNAIAMAVQRTAGATGTVTRSIGHVSVTAVQTGEAGQSVFDASIALAANADQLSREISIFKQVLQMA